MGYDTWLCPDDGPDDVPCLTKCPVCHGCARGMQRSAGVDIGPDGEPERLWEVTGVACDACGHLEGDECLDESEYANL